MIVLLTIMMAVMIMIKVFVKNGTHLRYFWKKMLLVDDLGDDDGVVG